jgi:hypothetical protein
MGRGHGEGTLLQKFPQTRLNILLVVENPF